MSIRTKMVLVFSVMSAIILLVASSAGYFFTKERISENIEKQMTANIDAHVNKLDGWLVSKRKEVELTAGTIQAVGNREISVALLQGYKSMDSELNDVYFASVDGKLVSGSGWVPPAGYDPRTRSWYKDAMREKKTIFTTPYADAQTKQVEVSVALPCQLASGQILGVVSADILLSMLEENIKEIKSDGQGYAFLVDKTGVILAHSESDMVSNNLFELEKTEGISKVVKTIMGKEQGIKNYQENGKDMLMVYKQIPSTQWTLCINVEQAIARQPLAYMKWLFIGITVVSILLVIAVTFVVARRITKPLKVLTQQVELLAQGDLTVQATVSGNDEFSKLANGFNKMVDDLRGMIDDIHGSTVEMQGSSSKLVDTAAHVAANTQEMSATVSMISTTLEQISAGTEENASSVEQVNHNVDAVDKMAGEVSATAKEAVNASERVAEEVKQVSVLIADVSQSINKVAAFAQEVAVSCKRSITITEEAKKRSGETNDIIRKLNSSSKQINSFVGIIRNIAEQTNMLALNATIEAASAGEAGKGFAVVAREVKELSKRTTEEAGHIARQIEEMQNDMNEAVVVVGKITDVIDETMDITQTIASAVSEQSSQGTYDTAIVAAEKNTGTSISKEVAIIATKSAHVAQNAIEAAKNVDEMFHTTADMYRMADDVATRTEEMAVMMNNISYATQEMARATQDIAQSIQETDKAIADTALKASTVSECSFDAGKIANQLKELVDKFKA
ncbi:MAG: mcpA 2 [Firmicutes bacterium]|nr:mcpA 2 [Bacillota bacterium]